MRPHPSTYTILRYYRAQPAHKPQRERIDRVAVLCKVSPTVVMQMVRDAGL
jgi:hypothetical protein